MTVIIFSRSYDVKNNKSSKRVVWTRPIGEIRKGEIIIISTKYLVPSTWYQVPGTKYLVPSTWYQVLGIKYLVPGTWFGIKY